MYRKAAVFAGTTEGRKIAGYLSGAGVYTIACTATGYGGALLEENAYLTVYSQRMDENQIRELLKEERPAIVVDATHPYATKITENIGSVCETLGLEYLRINRESGILTENQEIENSGDVVHVDTVKEAVEYLSGTSGNALIATGSKELSAFTKVEGYRERLYARVLSLPKVVEECAELGFSPSHLFAMQGPFSVEMNLAMLKQTNAAYFVSKESGVTGGFWEKYEAAQQMGAVLVVIGRPPQSAGVSFAEARRKLQQQFGLIPVKIITLVGIGMGAITGMTGEAKRAIAEAELIIGAERMLKAVLKAEKKYPRSTYCAYDPAAVCGYIEEHPEYENIAIVLSGDVGFYSGAKKLMQMLDQEVALIPGVSSLPYFAARLKTSWEDAAVLSLHGKTDNVIGKVLGCQKVFVLLGGKASVALLCAKLTDYGLGDVKVTVGENLSYDDEKIGTRKARDWQEAVTEPLSVALIENKWAEEKIITGGIPDRDFIRGKVPMTKEEIRCVALSKLKLKRQFVLYDIGAGTGSISVEAARAGEDGMVYAIEKNVAAIHLMEENCRRFAADNVVCIEGSAPQAFRALPMPTHAFIGGSSGNMKEIITELLHKNPAIRIVITAVSLETIAEAFTLCKEMNVEDFDVSSISVAKAKSLGTYHMMMGQNPVAIFSFTGGMPW